MKRMRLSDEASDQPPLCEAVVRIALGGWSALPRELSPEDSSAAFDVFAGNIPAVVDLWRAHESFLRSEGPRLGITPTWQAHGRGRPLFFGEALCVEARS